MKVFLKLGISLALIGAILWKLGGVGEVGSLIAGVSPFYLGLAFLVMTSDRFLMTFKWSGLLRGRGQRLPLLAGMKIYCAAMVWGVFLPATVGADTCRVVSTSRAGLDSNEVVSSVIIERMVGFLSALLLGLCAFLILLGMGILDSRFTFMWWVPLLLLAVASLIFAASFSRMAFYLIHDRFLGRWRENRITRRLRTFHLTYHGYQTNKGSLATFFGLTFAEQLLPILQSWLVAQALGVDVGLLFIAGVVPLALLLSRIPVSFDGLGVYDGAYLLLMSLAGIPAGAAVAITLTGRVTQIISWLPWWLAHTFDNRNLGRPRPVLK